VRHDYLLVRRRVVGNLKTKLWQAQRRLVLQTPQYVAWHFHPETLESCLAAVNSYLGHFKHAQSRGLIRKLWREFSFLSRFFKLSSQKLVRLDQPLRRKIALKQQARWLQRQFDGYVCLIQIGNYFEAFNAGAYRLAEKLKLKLQKNWRGFAVGCGFHHRLLPNRLAELKKQRVPVVVVRQTGRELYKTKERLPALMVEYSKE